MEVAKNIVVLGAGFGGLKAALTLSRHSKWLKKRGYKITLVDKNDYHTYTPTLYEIGATSKETANYIDLKSVVTFPLKEIFSNQDVSLRQAEVESINVQTAKIVLKGGDNIKYSHLIVALGTQTNYFDIPGLETKALVLKTFQDALNLRESIFANACNATYEQAVEVVIGGAGSTGVELAAELQEWFAQLKTEEVKCELHTTLINGDPRILPNLDSKVIKKSEKRLKKLGVTVLNKSIIGKIKRDQVILKGGVKVRFDNLIWAGGIKTNSLIEKMKLKVDRRNGIEVKKTLEAKPMRKNQKMAGKIYAVGDAAYFKNTLTKTPVPKLARPAISQGKIAALNIIKDLKSLKLKEFETTTEYPYVIPVGGKYAITKIGPLVVSGILGWILKGLIELNYIISIMPKKQALSTWLKGLKIFIQNDRLG